MANELPEFLNFRHLKERRGQLAGTYSASRLKRTAAILQPGRGCEVEISYDFNGENEALIEGRVITECILPCQRCLEAVEIGIDSVFSIRAVHEPSDARKVDGSDVETDEDRVPLTEQGVALLDIVEDEILLACPMIPVHDNASCRAALEIEQDTTSGRQKPFAGLSELLK